MSKKRKKNKINKKERKIAVKLLLSIVFLTVITILGICSFRIFQAEEMSVSWLNVKKSDQYAYMYISKMSEKFAYDETTNKSYHFVMEVEDTGIWHTYIIAINQNEYNKYKDVIDYTYERIETQQKVKVYGYPVLINEDLKSIALKNIKNFVPADNEIEITDKNFEKYLTNSYLDTTIPKNDDFNYILFALVMILVIIIALFIYVIFCKDKKIVKVEKKNKIETKQVKNNKNLKKEVVKVENKTTKEKISSKKDESKKTTSVKVDNQKKSTSEKKKDIKVEDDIEVI